MPLYETRMFDPTGDFFDETVWVTSWPSSYTRYLWHDRGRCYTDSTDYTGGWVLTEHHYPGPLLEIADEDTPDQRQIFDSWNDQWYEFAGYRYWEDSGRYLWRKVIDGWGDDWILSNGLGRWIKEQWDPVLEKYVGDNWYYNGNNSVEAKYTPAGSNRGNVEGDNTGTPKNITFKLEGYKITDNYPHTEPAGQYEKFIRTADIDASGTVTENVEVTADDTIIIGLKVFEDDTADDTEYIESIDEYNGKPRYGSIYYDNSYYYYDDGWESLDKWVIGTYLQGTWWEGEEPDMDSPVTFVEKTLDEDDNVVETGNEITITFKELRMGTKTTKQYMGTVPQWL